MKNSPEKSSSTSSFGRSSSLSKLIAASGLVASLLVNSVFADDASDISGLLQGGQYPEALKKADAYLSQHPRDAQMRFLKGVILTEQNKTSAAIAIFIKLTEDFPALPEPYNNLAVLYAAQGQFEKARTALDRAIRTNPAYATAYENLGDVHAKMASQAYDKALQLDSKNADAKSKLTLVRSLVDTADGAGKVASVAPAPKAPAAASAPPVALLEQKTNAAPAAPVASKVASKPPQIASAAPDPDKDITKATQKPASGANEERTAVLNSVKGWAHAWSTQNVKAYLGYYSSDFDTPNGMARKTWMEERRTRITDKGRITVNVESPTVNVNGNTATVNFRQRYVSDRMTANSRKTLVLIKTGDKWQIKQERTGN